MSLFRPIYQGGIAFCAASGLSNSTTSGTSFDKEQWVRSLTTEQRDLLRLEIETLDDSWLAYLHDHIVKEEFLELKRFLARETASGIPWFPPEEDLYRWSRCTPLHKVKVVILSQGPTNYEVIPADGLAFSLRPPHKARPTTRNIFTAVENDYPTFKRPENGEGSLTPWAERGVLLLNIRQTATTNDASQHQHFNRGWESLAARIIQVITHTHPGVVFMVWGASPQRILPRIRSRHLILRSSHPAPLSASRGFFTYGHFKRANDWLIAKYGPEAEIDWALEPGNSTINYSEEESRPRLTHEKGSEKTTAVAAGPNTFALFARLPFDIRREIYIMATPPRVVHVQEDPMPNEKTFENFKHHLKDTLPHHLRISPHLDLLRDESLPEQPEDLMDDVKQTTLDRYGFKRPSSTSAAALKRSAASAWWLSQRPLIAWKYCRRTQLFSKAPIPPLLHTCQESREVLVRYGYVLAFATHSAPAQTWFHNERDNLYLSRVVWKDSANVLVTEQLPLSQFIPEELQRVKNLSTSAEIMRQFHAKNGISDVLRLIPCLKSLYCVNSLLDLAAQRPCYMDPRITEGTPFQRVHVFDPQQPQRNVPRPLWKVVSANLADFRADELGWTSYLRFMPMNEYLDELEREESSDGSSDLLQGVTRNFQQRLADERARYKGEWSIPSVELVNIGTAPFIDKLLRQRKAYWAKST